MIGDYVLDDLIERLDGEAVVVDEDGKFCFNHAIYLNDICVECGTELQNG